MVMMVRHQHPEREEALWPQNTDKNTAPRSVRWTEWEKRKEDDQSKKQRVEEWKIKGGKERDEIKAMSPEERGEADKTNSPKKLLCDSV